MMRIPFYIALGAGLAWTPAALAKGEEKVDTSSASAPAMRVAEAPTPPPGELSPKTAPRSDLPRVELHGGAYFWYYQPFPTKDFEPFPTNNLELYLASLDFTGRLDDFGLVLNPRFRDSEARDFFTSNVWVEEAYAFWEKKHLTAKAGKIYSQFSRLSDNTFYGNIPYFDGLKLDSDYGVSLEGSYSTKSGWGFGYYAQYFLLDGGTNGSLRDRDTVWVDNDVHRHHTTIARIEPSYRFNSKASLRLGLAGEYTYVDFTKSEPSHVLRLSGDMSFVYSPVRFFGEFILQNGQTVTDYPIARKPAGVAPAQPGQASLHNYYIVAGAEVQVWRLTGRYAFSLVDYRDMPVIELLHLPGLAFTLHDNVSLMFEYAFWQRTNPGGARLILDNSMNAIIYARF